MIDTLANPWAGKSRTEIEHRAGQGNWGAYRALAMEVAPIREAARKWEHALRRVERPWLCWNVDDQWCLVQQRLVQEVGWTPVVGFDPRVGPPQLVAPGAVVIDFNEGIGLPVLYPHFPLEFAFLFADRLAFWHSDLLVRLPLLHALARHFAAQADGSTTVTASSPGLRHLLSVAKQRHWELIGCTTRAASLGQFEAGCGWWMEFWEHPNCPGAEEREHRRRYYWDHGAGIYFWHRRLGGKVEVIRDKSLHDGHFTKIGKKDYVRSVVMPGSDAQRSMNREINENFDLASACRSLGLGHLVTI